MRWLWVYMVLLVFLVMGSETSLMSQKVAGEEKEQLVSETTQLSSGSRGWQECIRLLQTSIFVRAWDLPGDEFPGLSLFTGKVIRSMERRIQTVGLERRISCRNYMRLLSARHIKGFYIYSLEKLII